MKHYKLLKWADMWADMRFVSTRSTPAYHKRSTLLISAIAQSFLPLGFPISLVVSHCPLDGGLNTEDQADGTRVNGIESEFHQ